MESESTIDLENEKYLTLDFKMIHKHLMGETRQSSQSQENLEPCK